MSKNRAKMPSMPQDGEIDLLIATDCISEGQNLQDCDYLINYDIHWNPVRIIQRFGRIDRIGSLNPPSSSSTSGPPQDLDKYINLKNRVEARMALVDIAATLEDNILKPRTLQELIHEDLQATATSNCSACRRRSSTSKTSARASPSTSSPWTTSAWNCCKYIESQPRAAWRTRPLGLYAVVPPRPASTRSSPPASSSACARRASQ